MNTPGIDEFQAGISSSWDDIIPYDAVSSVLSGLSKCELTPKRNQVLDAFRHCPLHMLKVVIMGQDPYPTKGDAHGLAFSSQTGQVPRSLKPIYKCLKNTGLIKHMPENGDLTNWAKQGVLLLNRYLTTEVGKRGAHAKLWKKTTDKIVANISAHAPAQVHFMLWGNNAMEVADLIDPRHQIYKQTHPSPLSQANITDPEMKFVNCPDFQTINAKLKEAGRQKIEWDPTVLPNIKYIRYAVKSNNHVGLRARTMWIATYKKGGKCMFVGGVVPFRPTKSAIEYNYDPLPWIMSQVGLVGEYEEAVHPRIEKRWGGLSNCRHGTTLRFK